MHAEVHGTWGTVSTCPSSPSISRFGFPVVWTKDTAFIYTPDGSKSFPYGDWEDIQPTVMGAEEAWEQIHSKLFTYIHFFSGPVPERFEGIHEALDFFPRIGGANGAELTALKAVMEKGAREGMSYHQMAPALSATKVPRSVIREWMFDSGCGNDLVSIESVAALRDHLRPLQEPKWFATANGANQANKVIDLDIPELGEVVTPM